MLISVGMCILINSEMKFVGFSLIVLIEKGTQRWLYKDVASWDTKGCCIIRGGGTSWRCHSPHISLAVLLDE